LKLSGCGGRLKGNESLLIAAAAGRSLSAIRSAAAPHILARSMLLGEILRWIVILSGTTVIASLLFLELARKPPLFFGPRYIAGKAAMSIVAALMSIGALLRSPIGWYGALAFSGYNLVDIIPALREFPPGHDLAASRRTALMFGATLVAFLLCLWTPSARLAFGVLPAH
jgi:hypothetical protein